MRSGEMSIIGICATVWRRRALYGKKLQSYQAKLTAIEVYFTSFILFPLVVGRSAVFERAPLLPRPITDVTLSAESPRISNFRNNNNTEIQAVLCCLDITRYLLFSVDSLSVWCFFFPFSRLCSSSVTSAIGSDRSRLTPARLDEARTYNTRQDGQANQDWRDRIEMRSPNSRRRRLFSTNLYSTFGFVEQLFFSLLFLREMIVRYLGDRGAIKIDGDIVSLI